MSKFITRLWTKSEVRTFVARLREGGYEVREDDIGETFRCDFFGIAVFSALEFKPGRYICRINKDFVTESIPQAC
jgi:hypothetical protein